MEKSFWGPSTWCMIHTTAAGYRPEHLHSFKQFMYSLPFLLPCEYCRGHLNENLKTLPLTDQSLASPRQLFMWTYFLHDLVNKQLKKKGSPPYQIVENYYFSHTHDNQIWGPCFWRAIHAFAASYRPDPKVRQAFKQFVYSLSGVIPCGTCKNRYDANLNQIPLTNDSLTNAHALFLWSYLFHDLFNKQLGKVSPPFETVKSQYFNEQVCSSCGAN